MYKTNCRISIVQSNRIGMTYLIISDYAVGEHWVCNSRYKMYLETDSRQEKYQVFIT